MANLDKISLAGADNKAFMFRDFLKSTVGHSLPKEIGGKFYFGKILGFGAFGAVYMAHNYITCAKFAVKIIRKTTLMNDMHCLREANNMKGLAHPCVLNLYDFHNKTDKMYLILEFMEGGDLKDRMLAERSLHEGVAKWFFYQISQALVYLHAQNITHRDLKADNCLLASKEEEYTLLKVTDFGFSKRLTDDKSDLRSMCGTRLYVFIYPLFYNLN